MSKAIENLQAAQHRAMAHRPKVGGFPYLAYYGCHGEEYMEHYPAAEFE